MKIKSKYSFAIPVEDGTFAHMIQGKEYDCIGKTDGSYFVLAENNKGLFMDKEEAENRSDYILVD